MSNTQRPNLFREIPAVDSLLGKAAVQQAAKTIPQDLVVQAIRGSLDGVRATLKKPEKSPFVQDGNLALERIEARVIQDIEALLAPSLRPVINGTGVVLHTNLGRAPLAPKAMEQIQNNACGYSNLEYDLDKRKRGSRHSHVEDLLKSLLGVEAALVVNNCAAAVLLGVAALAKSKEVIVSRGELVEIGGSFRIPEVMEAAGAQLKEVGTTNRTRIADYENAIHANTGLLLKAYPSNFAIMGFTEEVSVAEMAEIGKKHEIPSMMDLGSGLLVDLTPFGISGATQVQDVVATDVDLICFSGDKLLGGPQAGIITGKKHWVDQLKKHPMTRALRVDKMILSALEATLLSYLDGTWKDTVPAQRMLTATQSDLHQRTEEWIAKLRENGTLSDKIELRAVETIDKVGGGTLPLVELSGSGLCLSMKEKSPDQLEALLRNAETPIVGRVSEDGVVLHMRTLTDSNYPTIQKVLSTIDCEPA